LLNERRGSWLTRLASTAIHLFSGRGGMPGLTDAEMRRVTIYMLNQGTGAAK